MKERVQQKVQALIRRAEKSGTTLKASNASRNGSSLHQIIKTKEQAERFMKSLRSA